MDRSTDHLPQPWTGTKQRDLAPEEETVRLELSSLEEKPSRPEVLAPEDEAGWPKVLTLEEEVFAQDVPTDEASQPEVFTQTKCYM